MRLIDAHPRVELGDGVHVLVAAAGEIDEQVLVASPASAPASSRRRPRGSTRAPG